MQIFADKDITTATAAVSSYGDLHLFDGRDVVARDLRNADVLLVRAITRVDARLLAGTAVRFVGSVTAGIDHVDTAFLQTAEIPFAATPGCNARAVAEFVLICAVRYAVLRGVDLRELRFGIIGFGHAGRALAGKLDALGCDYSYNDPPLAALDPSLESTTLEQILAADVVTLHVPLVATGCYTTVDLIGARELARIRPGALLINAARGGVVDESALLARMMGVSPILTAIDCWRDEPDIDPALLEYAFIATPHVAGHTHEGRHTATAMLRAALVRWLGADDRQLAALSTDTSAGRLDLQVVEAAEAAALAAAAAHDIDAVSDRLRTLLTLDRRCAAAHFDILRRQCGMWREVEAYSVASTGLAPDTVDLLAALGFAVTEC